MTRSISFISFATAVACIALAPAPIHAQISPPGVEQPDDSAQTAEGPIEGPDGTRFVPNVVLQYRNLAENPEAMGFNLGTSPDPSACRHYQGIVRIEGADGTPYFLVTRSGNTPETPGHNEWNCDDSDGETRNGHLIVVRMGSRSRDGERLRSNRLSKGKHINLTAPPSEDVAIKYFTVIGGDPKAQQSSLRPGLVNGDAGATIQHRVYQHPGGMQLVGKMLAVALEAPRGAGLTQTKIMFFDVSNPESPVFKSEYTPITGAGTVRATAGTVAVTPLANNRYLMMTTGGENSTWYYYRSQYTDTVNQRTDLSSPNLSWDYVGSHPSPPPGVGDTHQTLQFLREGSIDGKLYLAGARGDPVYADLDRLDLYQVSCDTAECTPGEAINTTFVFRGRRLSPFPTTGAGTRLANLAAASTFHVTPSGELLFYATEHDNDGPSGSIKFAEWRNINMRRPTSPTFLPTIKINGPFQVDEGSMMSLTGSVQAPTAKAWIQLFHRLDFGGVDFASPSIVVDFDDYSRDDFDNFRVLELPFVHPNKVQSLKWYAPVGCSIRVNDDGGDSGNAPETLTLVGDGRMHDVADLRAVLNDAGTDSIDQEIDDVEFLSDCQQLSSRPYNLFWDLDRDGSFETPGTLAFFSAAQLDGPDTFDVPVQGKNLFGGTTADSKARIVVNNVKPRITELRTTGTHNFPASTGQINPSVPSVIMGQPVTILGTFTDPGLRDRQTASLNWDDGTVEREFNFTSFNDAFGDGSGELAHTHRFTTTGTRQITLTVGDNDGGASSKVVAVKVVSPAELVQSVVVRLDTVIASTTSDAVRQSLELARRALVGDARTSGAVQAINAGNYPGAISLTNQAIGLLQSSGSSGGGSLVAPLQQVVSALIALSRL